MTGIARQIYDAAFAPENGRHPRSEPYKQGVLDALRLHAGEIENLRAAGRRYETGTAESDAWLAGIHEGNMRWTHLRDQVHMRREAEA